MWCTTKSLIFLELNQNPVWVAKSTVRDEKLEHLCSTDDLYASIGYPFRVSDDQVAHFTVYHCCHGYSVGLWVHVGRGGYW